MRSLSPTLDSEFRKALETLALCHDTRKKAVAIRRPPTTSRAGRRSPGEDQRAGQVEEDESGVPVMVRPVQDGVGDQFTENVADERQVEGEVEAEEGEGGDHAGTVRRRGGIR